MMHGRPFERPVIGVISVEGSPPVLGKLYKYPLSRSLLEQNLNNPAEILALTPVNHERYA